MKIIHKRLVDCRILGDSWKMKCSGEQIIPADYSDMSSEDFRDKDKVYVEKGSFRWDHVTCPKCLSPKGENQR